MEAGVKYLIASVCKNKSPSRVNLLLIILHTRAESGNNKTLATINRDKGAIINSQPYIFFPLTGGRSRRVLIFLYKPYPGCVLKRGTKIKGSLVAPRYMYSN